MGTGVSEKSQVRECLLDPHLNDIIMNLIFVIISSIFTVLSTCDNNTRPANYKCANVYCINLDNYSKLDVPMDLVEVGKGLNVLTTFQTAILSARLGWI